MLPTIRPWSSAHLHPLTIQRVEHCIPLTTTSVSRCIFPTLLPPPPPSFKGASQSDLPAIRILGDEHSGHDHRGASRQITTHLSDGKLKSIWSKSVKKMTSTALMAESVSVGLSRTLQKGREMPPFVCTVCRCRRYGTAFPTIQAAEHRPFLVSCPEDPRIIKMINSKSLEATKDRYNPNGLGHCFPLHVYTPNDYSRLSST